MKINLKTRNLNKFYPFIVFLLAFLLFLKSCSFNFVYDDIYQIVNNKLVSSDAGFIDSFSRIFTTPTFPGQQYRPVVTFSYYLQNLVHGLNSSYFHLFNILLHCLVSLLVYYFVSSCLTNSKLAFFSALIFAVHPAQVESVVSIVGRAEIIAGFFALIALLLSIKEKGYYIPILICFSLACLSKESAFTLLIILPVFSYFYSKNKTQSYWYFAFLFLVSVLLILIRAIVLDDNFLISPTKGVYFSENPLFHTSILERVFPAFQIFGNYIFLFFFPLVLKVDYSINYGDFLSSIYSTKGILFSLISCIYFFLLILFRKKKEVLFLLFFGLAFGVTINFITPIGVYFAERLIYFPIIGLSVFFVFIIFKYFNEKYFYFLLISIVFIFTYRTFLRIPVWETNASIFKSMQEDNPNSARANLSYGMYLNNVEKNYKKARKYFSKGHRLEPRMTENARYLSDIAIKERKFKEAKYWLNQVLIYEPHDKKILNRIALVDQVINTK